MVTKAQSAANWHKMHTPVVRTHLLTHFTSTQLQPRCAREAPAQLLQNLELYFEGT